MVVVVWALAVLVGRGRSRYHIFELWEDTYVKYGTATISDVWWWSSSRLPLAFLAHFLQVGDKNRKHRERKRKRKKSSAKFHSIYLGMMTACWSRLNKLINCRIWLFPFSFGQQDFYFCFLFAFKLNFVVRQQCFLPAKRKKKNWKWKQKQHDLTSTRSAIGVRLWNGTVEIWFLIGLKTRLDRASVPTVVITAHFTGFNANTIQATEAFLLMTTHEHTEKKNIHADEAATESNHWPHARSHLFILNSHFVYLCMKSIFHVAYIYIRFVRAVPSATIETRNEWIHNFIFNASFKCIHFAGCWCCCLLLSSTDAADDAGIRKQR